MPDLRDRSTLKRTTRAREAEEDQQQSDMPALKRIKPTGCSTIPNTTKTSEAKRVVSKARQTAKDASKNRNSKAKALSSRTQNQQRLVPSQSIKRRHESAEQLALDESRGESAVISGAELFEGPARTSKRRALVDIRQATAVFPPIRQTEQPDSPRAAPPSSQKENRASNNAALRQASRTSTIQKYKQAKKMFKAMPALPEPKLDSKDSANPPQRLKSSPKKCEPRPGYSLDLAGIQVDTAGAEGAEGAVQLDNDLHHIEAPLSTPTILKLNAGSASSFITLKVRTTNHNARQFQQPAAISQLLESVEETAKDGGSSGNCGSESKTAGKLGAKKARQPFARKNKLPSAEATAAAGKRSAGALFQEEDLNRVPSARAVFEQQLRERVKTCPSNKLAARRFKADLQKWAEKKGFPETYDAFGVHAAVKSSIDQIGAFSKLTAASRVNLDQLED